MLPLVYTNPTAAIIFLAACLIWNLPEMPVMLKQFEGVVRTEAVDQEGSRFIVKKAG